MDIKSILLAGGSVKFSYKENVTDWVGSADIYSIAPNGGLDSMICVNVPTEDGYGKRFDYDKINDAVEFFKRLVFSEKNLWYKHHEALIELDDSNIELEDEDDFVHYEVKRLEIIKREK